MTHLLLFILIAYRSVNQGLCVDMTRYHEGKHQFELIQQNSNRPRYGFCWKNAISAIQSGCKRLTDVEQTRLALAYLNCFLQVSCFEKTI